MGRGDANTPNETVILDNTSLTGTGIQINNQDVIRDHFMNEKNFADHVDVSIMQLILRRIFDTGTDSAPDTHNISLIIIDKISTDLNILEDRLRNIIKWKSAEIGQKRCLVLTLNELHYNYVSFGGDTLPTLDVIKKCLAKRVDNRVSSVDFNDSPRASGTDSQDLGLIPYPMLNKFPPGF